MPLSHSQADLTAQVPSQAGDVSPSLTEAHKEAIFGVFSTFYKELSGRWQTTVLADIWEGPNAVMVNQLNVSPMQPSVAQSLISMLATITQAKPEPNGTVLARSGALEALYSIAFEHRARLDLVAYDRLPESHLNAEEARAWVRCCITLKALQELEEPVVIRSQAGVHLFEFAALKQTWRESFRFINPMSRQAVSQDQLMALKHAARPSQSTP